LVGGGRWDLWTDLVRVGLAWVAVRVLPWAVALASVRLAAVRLAAAGLAWTRLAAAGLAWTSLRWMATRSAAC
jgi:hypothetical protein